MYTVPWGPDPTTDTSQEAQNKKWGYWQNRINRASLVMLNWKKSKNPFFPTWIAWQTNDNNFSMRINVWTNFLSISLNRSEHITTKPQSSFTLRLLSF